MTLSHPVLLRQGAPTPLARATAGALLLDAAEPGWWRRVVLELLDLRSCAWCPLGQVFDGYCVGLAELGITADEAPELGFEHDCGADPNAIAADYAALRAEWVALILQRQEAE